MEASQIEADMIEEEHAAINRGFIDLNFGETSNKVYGDLATCHPAAAQTQLSVVLSEVNNENK
jgi:hypothetical protein